MTALAQRVCDELLAAGLSAAGVGSAAPFEEARAALEQRKAAGLAGTMQFTYRNPERSTDPSRVVDDARAIVVGALSYRRADRPPPSEVAVPARVARYAWRDHYRVLRAALERGADVLRAERFVARVVADDNALVDRAAAHRAGLGWFGKNANLLLPGHGSWFVLGSIVTDAPLPAADDVVDDGCGSCQQCITACPTGAIVAPGVVDATKCIAWLVQAPGSIPRELREAVGDRMYGCDDCQEVCPPNRIDDRRRPPPDAHPAADDWTDALEILVAADDDLLARFGRWYLPRREPRHLRRNALVVLGNTADGDDPVVGAALQRALGDPDPMLRAHAVWASARLGRHDLLVELRSSEADPEVREELQLAGTPVPEST